MPVESRCTCLRQAALVVPNPSGNGAQRDNLFYPSWAFALPNIVLLQLPQATVESLIWSVIT